MFIARFKTNTRTAADLMWGVHGTMHLPGFLYHLACSAATERTDEWNVILIIRSGTTHFSVKEGKTAQVVADPKWPEGFDPGELEWEEG